MWRPIAASKSPRSNYAEGMTLVEVLLAVTLFSTMMGATAALLQAGFRAQSTWGAVVEPVVRLERTLNRINLDMASAQKLFAIPVHGTKDAFEFARVEPMIMEGASSPSAEWARIVYKMDQEEGASVLVREAATWRASQDGAQLQTREVLLPVTEATWAFARIDKQGQLLWSDAWDGTVDGVPRSVRLTCTLPMASGNSLTLSRVFRNPAGNLPVEEQQP